MGLALAVEGLAMDAMDIIVDVITLGEVEGVALEVDTVVGVGAVEVAVPEVMFFTFKSGTDGTAQRNLRKTGNFVEDSCGFIICTIDFHLTKEDESVRSI